jgi:hypothetical protein
MAGMVAIRLARDEARRIAVRAQLLDAPRPTDLLDLVRPTTRSGATSGRTGSRHRLVLTL